MMRATHSKNFDKAQPEVKPEPVIHKPVSTAEIFVQIPEVREISIGTDTNNFILASKKPIHPISIGFTENDAAWITSQFQPKS